MISFVIYYHSSRVGNLEQTLRFLERREPELVGKAEIVLICQDECRPPITKFRIKQFDLNLSRYLKPVMCNHGVRNAKYQKIVLLDSDRILPAGYFTRNTALMTPKQVITTECLFSLDKDYTDEEIESGNVSKHDDFRSKTNELRRKNMFSGNTILWKNDYLSCGMDESFVGYGYADNDMTEAMKNLGCDQIFLHEEELHLNHPKTIHYDKELAARSFKIIAAINAAKYLVKWNKKADRIFFGLAREVLEDPDNTDEQKSIFLKQAEQLLPKLI